ncbi:MAG TPA: PQQ-binding-like beta-propeller repeat protein, partial [Solirubrobacterales bacterium]|nr:PQQ-binding-like beta-propeller repeat protein [Solirubrobacterales bacterium]
MRGLNKIGWGAAVVPIAAVATGAVLLLAGGASDADDPPGASAAYPGGNPANHRHAIGPLEAANVSRLEVAWRLPLSGQSLFGRHASLPVVSGGVVYSQDLASNVQAIDLRSGEVIWEKLYESQSVGPNGVVVAGDSVLGATATEAFALDRESGEERWAVELVRNGVEGIDMAPGYRDGRVYVSTVPVNVSGGYRGGGVGVLWALDAESGERLWRFDTVPADLWGRPDVNAGGGLWYPPSFDEEGFMYFGVGNPAPFSGTVEFPWGSSRPGPNLYTNSMVKLDAASGELQWHYQLTPHDVYDWDFQNSPVLVEAGGKELAIGAGKAGVVIALDRETGTVAWRRAVGTHNGHDADSILAMNGQHEALESPATVFPGMTGGVIAPMATDGSALFVPIVNNAMIVAADKEPRMSPSSSGEIVALDLASGEVEWKRVLPAPAYGATTTVNDIVLATTYDGTIYALETDDGQVAWQEKLPAGTNTGVTVAGDTVIAPAGVADGDQVAQIVAYRLGDGGNAVSAQARRAESSGSAIGAGGVR